MADSIEDRFAFETELLGLKLLPGQEANLRTAYAALREAIALVGADQCDRLAQHAVGRAQICLLARQELQAEQFGLDGEAVFDIVGHGAHSAAAAVGAARLCNRVIISSVERTSANMTIRLASVALCSASVRQAFASDTKNTL